jgi:hypothetical protein
MGLRPRLFSIIMVLCLERRAGFLVVERARLPLPFDPPLPFDLRRANLPHLPFCRVSTPCRMRHYSLILKRPSYFVVSMINTTMHSGQDNEYQSYGLPGTPLLGNSVDKLCLHDRLHEEAARVHTSRYKLVRVVLVDQGGWGQMPDQEDHVRVVRSSPESTVEYSFDDLARGLASGTISRRKALKWMGGAFLGGVLVSIPGLAWAKPKPGKCTHDKQCPGGHCQDGVCGCVCDPPDGVCPDGTFKCSGSGLMRTVCCPDTTTQCTPAACS